jgi:hypothetical protein
MGLTEIEREMLRNVHELASMKEQMRQKAESIIRLQQEIRRMEKRVAFNKEQCQMKGEAK